MKLDRNTNRGGRGKYALVNMRKLIPFLERMEANDPLTVEEEGLLHCFQVLRDSGIITLGNETPGDQFFVMKYKDQFTHHALAAYAKEVCMEAARRVGKPERDGFRELLEYGEQMVAEANAAKELGNRIPD